MRGVVFKLWLFIKVQLDVLCWSLTSALGAKGLTKFNLILKIVITMTQLVINNVLLTTCSKLLVALFHPIKWQALCVSLYNFDLFFYKSHTSPLNKLTIYDSIIRQHWLMFLNHLFQIACHIKGSGHYW